MDTPEKAWQELNEQRRREYFTMTMYQFSCVAPLAFAFFFGAAVMWFSGIR